MNFELRIDAEYYRAEVLDKVHLSDKKSTDILENLASFVVGPFGSTVKVNQYVGKSEYRYVRNKDINDFIISDDEPALIPENVYKSLSQFHIRENDLLITVVGTLGKVAIAQAKDSKSIFSCKSTLIKSIGIDPFYLLTYLNSKTGQIFALRGVRGAIQQGLNLSDLKDIKVFIPSKEYQHFIKQIVCESFNLTNKANYCYSQAEQILLSELNLLNWKPEHRLSFVKKYSDTQSASRIDAEYFQPMYEEIVEAVKKYKGGFDELGQVAKTKRGSLIPDNFYNKEKGIVYIRGADFSSGFLRDDKIVFIDESFRPNNETKIRKGDIVFALIGSVGSTALVDEEFNNAFISNNLGKITTKNYNATVLQVLLHSIIGKMYFEKEQSQTAQPKISDKDIHRFILPLLKGEIAERIETYYFESQKAKHLSKSLLEVAKHGVEMAIEKDEKHAQKWMDEEFKKLNIK